MPYKADLANFIADWWQCGVLWALSFAAYITGRERQRHKVDDVGKQLEDVEKEQARQGARILALEKQGNAEAVTLAEIVTTQGHILKALEEIKGTLKGKADK